MGTSKLTFAHGFPKVVACALSSLARTAAPGPPRPARRGTATLPGNRYKREPKSTWVCGVVREAKGEAGLYQILISQRSDSLQGVR